jgi:general stress protein CsbA
MLVVPSDRDQKRQVRRNSMCGTVLFALGIIGAIASAVTGSVWVIVVAVVFLVAGALMLYQVGKSLP